MTPNTSLRSLLLLAIGATAVAASAAPATYTVSGVASGTLNGVAFQNQAFSLVGVGDAAGVYDYASGIRMNANLAMSFSLGTTTGTLAQVGDVFVNDGMTCAGFGLGGSKGDVLDLAALGYRGVDLKSNLDATSGITFLLHLNNVATSAGTLNVTSFDGGSFRVASSFAPQPTPEPASFAALGVGAVTLLRRKR